LADPVFIHTQTSSYPSFQWSSFDGYWEYFVSAEHGCSKKVIPLCCLIWGSEAASMMASQIKSLKMGKNERKKNIETILCAVVGTANHQHAFRCT